MSTRPEFPGCRVYKRVRSRYWYLEYPDPLSGRTLQRSSGKTEEPDAWAELARLLRAASEPSWREAVVHFFQERSDLEPTTMKQYQNSVRVLDPFVGHLLLSEIDSKILKRFMSTRRQSVSDASVRRDLATGSTIFTTAQHTLPRDVPDANPFRMLSKRHLKENRRRRFLTETEYQKIEGALNTLQHRVILQTFVYTGMRHGEVRAFRKDWIKWDNGTYGEIQLPEELTKNDEPRVLPLFPKYRQTLEEWCLQASGDHVFSHGPHHEPYSSFQMFWRRARDRAGVKDVRIHDLRHTFASWWVQRGGNLAALKEMLGHADMRMVARYAHLDTEAQHSAVGKIGDLM